MYNFDEIIDRKNTNAENVEGFRPYMFADQPDIKFPTPDDELVRMWVADMAGMMFSNIIIRDERLRQTFVNNDKIIGAINPLSLVANQAAYEKGGSWLKQLREYLDENFDFTVKYISENIPGAKYKGSESTYLAWVDLNGCLGDGEDLPTFFAKEAGVLMEGGDRLFVGNAKGFVRLNLAMPRAIIKDGLERMANAIAKHKE